MAYAAPGDGVKNTTYSKVFQYAKSIRSAFFRSQASMDASSGNRPPPPSSMEALFPKYGFISTVPGLTTQISAVTPTSSSVCIRYQSESFRKIEGATGALFDSGYKISPHGCGGQPGPLSGTVFGFKTLDTQDVPSYSLFSEKALTYQGPSLDAFVNPSVTLKAGLNRPGDSVAFTFYNPPSVVYTDAQGVAYCAVNGVTQATIREGFSVANGCSEVQPGASCDVVVQYDGKPGGDSASNEVGSLALTFSDGGFMRVNILGLIDSGKGPLSSITKQPETSEAYSPVPCASSASQAKTPGQSGVAHSRGGKPARPHPHGRLR